MKIEKGVMVIKDGLAWGRAYDDGTTKIEGWVDFASGRIGDAGICTLPEHLYVGFSRDPAIEEIKTGRLVRVERRTDVVFLEVLA